jgi:hypothetical protein
MATPEELGEEAMKRVKSKLPKLKKVNPRKENPPAIRGEYAKHVTWGEGRSRSPMGRHRRED